jgi:hypothetical protein
MFLIYESRVADEPRTNNQYARIKRGDRAFGEDGREA